VHPLSSGLKRRVKTSQVTPLSQLRLKETLMARLIDNSHGNCPDELRYSVALGLVPNWESFRKFGMNESVASGTTDMWPPATPRVLPTAAAVVSIVSDSGDDVLTTGTGGWEIIIYGLDINGLEITEEVNLNGTNAVTSTASFYRINRMIVHEAGSGGHNAGNISASIGGDLQAYVEAEQGQTHQTMGTLPSNKKLLISSYHIGCGRMAGSTQLAILGQVKPPGYAWRTISDIHLWDGGQYTNDQAALVMPPSTEYKLQIIADTTTEAFGVISGFLIKLD
jgi:hypothetical protein